MVQRITFFLLALIVSVRASAQIISGTVTDEASGEPLIGATVKLAGTQLGTVTDLVGHYSIKAQYGSNQLEFSYVGYSSESRRVSTMDGKDATCNVSLALSEDMLDEVVVSAGRFEQNLNEVTVSMAVMKAVDVKQQAPGDIQGALKTLSGVEIVDKQPSIRGGGGWTYSVGARSQILLDGLTILNPKTGEVNWNSIPMENLSQIEVIKGASSVLYGSSALNGVINIRTERPGLEPVTKLSLYTGFYGKYDTDSYNYTSNGYWNIRDYKVSCLGRHLGMAGVRQPMYDGLDLNHTRRIGNFDLSLAGNLYTDEGYRQQSYNQRTHLSGALTYHQPMPAGKYMNYGANISYLGNQYGDFFIWRSPSEPTKPSPVTNLGREENVINVDPFFNYTNDNTGISHKVRARINFLADNTTAPSESANILNWIKRQEINTDNLKDMLSSLVDGDVTQFVPLISALNNEDYEALLGEAVELLTGIFPEMTTTDVMDIAGLAMQLMAPAEDRIAVDHSWNVYMDYQFAKQWQNGARITTGATWNRVDNNSSITGYHVSDNIAAYLQYDQRFFDRLSVSAGARFEYYRVDTLMKEANMQIGNWTMPVRPVFRAGLNYQAAKGTFIRASFGQGYRNPSITEKYARKDIGGVGVYPNLYLKPESGFNAELGLKQAVKAGKWTGMFDLAGFYTEYRNMIEFNFGLFDNATYENITTLDGAISALSGLLEGNGGIGIGAQFVNVSHARIYGAEIEHSGDWEVFRDSHFHYSLSYLFTEPEDVDYKQRNEEEAQYTDAFKMKVSSNESKYLKYRNKHTFKAALDFTYKRFNIGTNISWRSKMLAVDYLMLDERQKDNKEIMDYFREILFGKSYVSEILGDNEHAETLADYWTKHNTNYWLMDLHMGIQCTKWLDMQLMVNNLLNTEYSYRPMALAAPRTYVIKANFKF